MRDIDPNSFARLMGLPPQLRHDLLEFLGQTSVPPEELDRLLTRLEREAGDPANRLN